MVLAALNLAQGIPDALRAAQHYGGLAYNYTRDSPTLRRLISEYAPLASGLAGAYGVYKASRRYPDNFYGKTNRDRALFRARNEFNMASRFNRFLRRGSYGKESWKRYSSRLSVFPKRQFRSDAINRSARRYFRRYPYRRRRRRF